MAEPLIIRVPGEPTGKGRPRMTRKGHAYTPEKTARAENLVAMCAMEQIGQPVLDGPLKVELEFRCAIPASWSQKRQLAALAGQERPTKKPDIDNAMKLACDALNGIAWRDDAQIVAASLSKGYAREPGTIIRIWQVPT